MTEPQNAAVSFSTHTWFGSHVVAALSGEEPWPPFA